MVITSKTTIYANVISQKLTKDEFLFLCNLMFLKVSLSQSLVMQQGKTNVMTRLRP